MNRTLYLVVAVVLTVSLTACVARADKKPPRVAEKIPVEKADLGYSVTFPNELNAPDVTEQKTDYAILKVFTSSCTLGDLVYSVTFTEYPAEFAKKGVKPSELLDGVREGMKGSDGEIVSKVERDTQKVGDDTVDVQRFRIDAKNNSLRVRAYLRGTRLYLVSVAGKKDRITDPAVEEFFKSFELLK